MKIFKNLFIAFLAVNGIGFVFGVGGKSTTSTSKKKVGSSSTTPSSSITPSQTKTLLTELYKNMASIIFDPSDKEKYFPNEIVIDDKNFLTHSNITKIQTSWNNLLKNTIDAKEVTEFLKSNSEFISYLLDFILLNIFNDDSLNEKQIKEYINQLSTMFKTTNFDLNAYAIAQFHDGFIKSLLKTTILNQLQKDKDIENFSKDFFNIKTPYINIINDIKEIIDCVDNKARKITNFTELNEFFEKFINLNEKINNFNTTNNICNPNDSLLSLNSLRKFEIFNVFSNQRIKDGIFGCFDKDPMKIKLDGHSRLPHYLQIILNELNLNFKNRYDPDDGLPEYVNKIDEIKQEDKAIGSLIKKSKEFDASLDSLKAKYDKDNGDFNNHFNNESDFIAFFETKKIQLEDLKFINQLKSSLNINNLEYFLLDSSLQTSIETSLNLKQSIEKHMVSQAFTDKKNQESDALQVYNIQKNNLNVKINEVQNIQQEIGDLDWKTQSSDALSLLEQWEIKINEIINDYDGLTTASKSLKFQYNPEEEKGFVDGLNDLNSNFQKHIPLQSISNTTSKEDCQSSVTDFKKAITWFINLGKAVSDYETKKDETCKNNIEKIFKDTNFPKKNQLLDVDLFNISSKVKDVYEFCDDLLKIILPPKPPVNDNTLKPNQTINNKPNPVDINNQPPVNNNKPTNMDNDQTSNNKPNPVDLNNQTPVNNNQKISYNLDKKHQSNIKSSKDLDISKQKKDEQGLKIMWLGILGFMGVGGSFFWLRKYNKNKEAPKYKRTNIYQKINQTGQEDGQNNEISQG
jgi:hypothetical protein